MARYIEEEEEEFEDDNFEASEESFDGDDDEILLEEVPDERSRMRMYTERRRRIEDLIETSRLRDELGIYDDDLFAN